MSHCSHFWCAPQFLAECPLHQSTEHCNVFASLPFHNPYLNYSPSQLMTVISTLFLFSLALYVSASFYVYLSFLHFWNPSESLFFLLLAQMKAILKLCHSFFFPHRIPLFSHISQILLYSQYSKFSISKNDLYLNITPNSLIFVLELLLGYTDDSSNVTYPQIISSSDIQWTRLSRPFVIISMGLRWAILIYKIKF